MSGCLAKPLVLATTSDHSAAGDEVAVHKGAAVMS